MSKHVFLSFVQEDLDLVNLFRGQAKRKNAGLDFDDYSVKVPYDSTNAAYIRTQISAKIRAASVTICLLGPTTSTSSWVKWEIEKSGDLGNQVFGVQLYTDRVCPIPSALTALVAPTFKWDIDAIVKAIG